jgi:hypothetical protein
MPECVFLPACQESQGTEHNFAIAKAGKSRILVGANRRSRLAPKKYREKLQAEKIIMLKKIMRYYYNLKMYYMFKSTRRYYNLKSIK